MDRRGVFQAAETEIGLDQHQHRRWTAGHRWTTVVIAAHAFLAAAITLRSADVEGLCPITVDELRWLPDDLVVRSAASVAVITWFIIRSRQEQPLRKTSPH